SGGLFPEQRLTRAEAVRGATWAGIHMARGERELGSITPGHLADLVVLDRDLFDGDPSALPETRVRYTLLGGEVVHAA
ncbi:amidohydrolase family protein, partial [Streptosporangium algeriense]